GLGEDGLAGVFVEARVGALEVESPHQLPARLDEPRILRRLLVRRDRLIDWPRVRLGALASLLAAAVPLVAFFDERVGGISLRQIRGAVRQARHALLAGRRRGRGDRSENAAHFEEAHAPSLSRPGDRLDVEDPMTENKPVSVKITIDEATAEGHYVNFANILHNPTEFVLDFGRSVPGRPDVKVMCRILTTPYHARHLLRAPQENVGPDEEPCGPIRSDFQPPLVEATDTKTN